MCKLSTEQKTRQSKTNQLSESEVVAVAVCGCDSGVQEKKGQISTPTFTETVRSRKPSLDSSRRCHKGQTILNERSKAGATTGMKQVGTCAALGRCASVKRQSFPFEKAFKSTAGEKVAVKGGRMDEC